MKISRIPSSVRDIYRERDIYIDMIVNSNRSQLVKERKETFKLRD